MSSRNKNISLTKEPSNYRSFSSRCEACNKILKKSEMYRGMCGSCLSISKMQFRYSTDHEYHHQNLSDTHIDNMGGRDDWYD